MNRIKIGPQGTMTQSPAAHSESNFPGTTTEAFFDLGEHLGDARHGERAVFMPLHYEPNYSYPLIVWLHQDGDDESRLADLMFDVSLRNYVAVAPRGPESSWSEGFTWPQTLQNIEQSHLAVAAAIDEACGRFNINSQRIYLAGEGAGGTMAFRLACREPELFAGVISLNGQFPEGLVPLSRLKSCRQLPVLWGHARESGSFAESQLCHQLKLLHICGFSVTLRQYPCDDHLMSQAYRDVDVWIMDSINGTDELTSSE